MSRLTVKDTSFSIRGKEDANSPGSLERRIIDLAQSSVSGHLVNVGAAAGHSGFLAAPRNLDVQCRNTLPIR